MLNQATVAALHMTRVITVFILLALALYSIYIGWLLTPFILVGAAMLIVLDLV